MYLEEQTLSWKNVESIESFRSAHPHGSSFQKPLADRSIAWIIGIPIMPFQSIEIKPGSMIYPLNPFGNLHTLALVDLSLKFHSRLFLQSQQTDSHVFSNARKRLPEGITINQHNRSVKSKIEGAFLPSGHHPFHHFSSMILPANLHYQRGRAPKKRSSGSTILHWPSHISQRYPHNFPLVSYIFRSYPINSRIIPMTSNSTFQELVSHIHWLNANKKEGSCPLQHPGTVSLNWEMQASFASDICWGTCQTN